MSGRRILWTRRALRRLDAIGAYVARDNPVAAANVVARIVAAVDSLADHPEKGRVGRIATTRELVVPHLPYIVPYRIGADAVEILTVLHTARHWPQDL